MSHWRGIKICLRGSLRKRPFNSCGPRSQALHFSLCSNLLGHQSFEPCFNGGLLFFKLRDKNKHVYHGLQLSAVVLTVCNCMQLFQHSATVLSVYTVCKCLDTIQLSGYAMVFAVAVHVWLNVYFLLLFSDVFVVPLPFIFLATLVSCPAILKRRCTAIT